MSLKDPSKTTISVMLSTAFAFTCISSSAQPTDSQQKAAQKRIEMREKIEKARRDIEKNIHSPSAKGQEIDYQQRAINNLAAAELTYETAKKGKNSNRAAYIGALVNLAQAYYETKSYKEASQFASEAYREYATLGKDSTDEPTCREQLWKVVGMLPTSEFQQRFETLFRVMLQKASFDEEARNALSGIPNQREQIDPDASIDRAALLKSLIDICSAVRGPNDGRLYWYLEQYADDCKIHNRRAEAQEALLRMGQLNPNTSDKWQSPLTAKIHLALLYVQFHMLDKADSLLPGLLTEIKPDFDTRAANEFGQLAYAYIAAARLDDADKITSALLSVANDQILSAISSVSDKLVESYTLNMSFEKARTLLIKRVKASENCQNDYASTVVRMQLSNIDLALGDEAESNRLFEQVKKLTALRGNDMERLLSDRAKLVEALKK